MSFPSCSYLSGGEWSYPVAARSSRPLRFIAWVSLVWWTLLFSAPSWGAKGEKITLNLKDADLSAVIATVSEMTGKNFIVDPRVKAKVTVISAHPVDADELYQVFLSLLNVHGFTVVPGENASKIIPLVNAKQENIPTVDERNPGRGDEYVTRVIQVQNVAVAQLVPILRPLLSQQAHLAAYPPSNVLIASGEAGTVDRVVKIIERIDTTGDEEVEIMPLAHASAPEIVRILQSLDKGAAPDQAPLGRPTMVADERTNSIIISGGPAQRLRLRALISHLDTPLESGGNTEVIYLRYASAKSLAPILTSASTGIAAAAAGKDARGGAAAPGQPVAAAPASAAGGGGKELINIQADESMNALVITAPPDVMRSIKTVIRRLDVRRAQVQVEAIVAEISADRAREFGVQWLFNGAPSNGPVGAVNFGTVGTLAAAAIPGANLTNVSNVANMIPSGATIAGGAITGNGNQFAGILRALSTDADSNILSTPSLVMLDNEEAEIVVGKNVPFVTGSYATTGAATTANPFTTIQRQDVGITLKVKPQINEGSAIRLTVTQEVSDVAQAATPGAADLVTNKRSLKTTVMADNGQIIVLGGLIDETLTDKEQKVPLLGDIPILGWLFSYKTAQKIKRNLMIFLHPVILRDANQTSVSAEEKYNYIRSQQLAVRERGIPLLPDSYSPVLPDLHVLTTLPPGYLPVPGPETAPPGTDGAGAVQNQGAPDEQGAVDVRPQPVSSAPGRSGAAQGGGESPAAAPDRVEEPVAAE